MTELPPIGTSAESQALLNGHRGHLHRPGVGAGQAGQQESPSSINDIWKACAYGDLDQLNTCLKQDVSQVCSFDILQQIGVVLHLLQVNAPDEQGYVPLQWAALNNRVAVLSLLLGHGAHVDKADGTGQTPLHWAAVRGSLQAAETLLRAGANLRLQDCRGYTLCHVAAQYGQTAFLYHVALRWGADVDLPDDDGRTPLHWAAYKGYGDTIRLLLVMDARSHLADKEGCTPLHWAAIRGNGEACTLLLQGGSSALLTVTDVTGSTPAQLAVQKGHRFLGVHLAEHRQREEGEQGLCGKHGALRWLTATHMAPSIWALIIGLVAIFMFKVVGNPSIGPPAPSTSAWAWSVVLTAGVGLVILYQTTISDPGYLPCGKGRPAGRGAGMLKAGARSSDAAAAGVAERKARLGSKQDDQSYDHYRSLDSPALWAGHWHQLCVSCKIVRPLRAKHCSVSGRCVALFDHFCPWVGNCIGGNNRRHFLVFLWLELYAMVVAGVVACLRLHRAAVMDAWSTAAGLGWIVGFVVIDLLVGVSVGALAITQASQIARNVTTNELANWHRYKYLKDGQGSFSNPFDRGCRTNCAEAMHPAAVPQAPFIVQGEGQQTMSLLKMEQGQHANESALQHSTE